MSGVNQPAGSAPASRTSGGTCTKMPGVVAIDVPPVPPPPGGRIIGMVMDFGQYSHRDWLGCRDRKEEGALTRDRCFLSPRDALISVHEIE